MHLREDEDLLRTCDPLADESLLTVVVVLPILPISRVCVFVLQLK